MVELFACLGSGNCFKPWLAMQQLNIPFEVRLIDVLAGEQKSDWFLRHNPSGVVPYMVTPDGVGIGESNAMLWYLAEGSPLMPTAKTERAAALQWMFFEQSKIEPFISPARFFTTILPQEKENRAADIAAWQAGAETGLARLEAHLSTREFMLECGYCVADISMFGYTHVLEEAGLSLTDYPAIAAWITAVQHTPGFRDLSKLGIDHTQAA